MATEMETDEAVVFIVDGREVSNDRRWYAQNLQKQRNEQARAQVEATSENSAGSRTPGNYSEMKPAELKELAEARNLDLTGVKKKSQLVKLLEEDDAAGQDFTLTGQDTPPAPAPAGVEDEDDSEDDGEA